MSGPKGIDIRPSPEELARREAARERAAAESEYRRLVAAATRHAQTLEMCGVAPSTGLPNRLESLIQELDGGTGSRGALSEARRRIVDLENAAGQALAALRSRQAALIQRRRVLAENAGLFRMARDRTTRERATRLLAGLERLAVPEPGPHLMAELAATESALDEATAELEALSVAVSAAAEAERDELLADIMRPAEGLKTVVTGPISSGTTEFRAALDAAEAVLQEASEVLLGTPEWRELEAIAAEVESQPTAAARQNRVGVLRAAANVRITRELQRRAWLDELDRLVDEAAHVRDGAPGPILDSLASLRERGEVVPLDAYRSRLRAAVRAEEERRSAQQALAAISGALTDLGYGITVQEMQTALVENGRLVVQRDPRDAHAVVLRASTGLEHVHTEVVRITPAASLDDQRMDHEREARWCEEHALIRDRLKSQGFETKLVMKHLPGSRPLRALQEAAPERRDQEDRFLSLLEDEA